MRPAGSICAPARPETKWTTSRAGSTPSHREIKRQNCLTASRTGTSTRWRRGSFCFLSVWRYRKWDGGNYDNGAWHVLRGTKGDRGFDPHGRLGSRITYHGRRLSLAIEGRQPSIQERELRQGCGALPGRAHRHAL